MAWEITTTELLERYAVGERNFAGIELLPPPGVSNDARSGIDLEGAILRDINLRGADLSYAELTGADLTGADLFGAYLEMAVLEGAIIKDANLRGASLRWCRLDRVNFDGSELTLSKLLVLLFGKLIFLTLVTPFWLKPTSKVLMLLLALSAVKLTLFGKLFSLMELSKKLLTVAGTTTLMSKLDAVDIRNIER